MAIGVPGGDPRLRGMAPPRWLPRWAWGKIVKYFWSKGTRELRESGYFDPAS